MLMIIKEIYDTISGYKVCTAGYYNEAYPYINNINMFNI